MYTSRVLRKMRYIHNHGRYVMCVMYTSFYCEVMGCHGGYDTMPCHSRDADVKSRHTNHGAVYITPVNHP